jgi:hypothetical protein
MMRSDEGVAPYRRLCQPKLTDKPKFEALAERLITCEASPKNFFEKFSKFL